MTTAKAAATRFIFISVSLLPACVSCRSYADFTLPPLPFTPPAHLKLEMQPEPVLTRGDWDSSDVLNPSVLFRDTVYVNFYSGFDGKTWHTGLAQSADGRHWRKAGKVLSPDPATWEGSYIAANGSAVFEGGEYWYWYQAGPRDTPSIGFARSADGRSWRKEPKPVLEPGPRGSFDERGVADPYVVRFGEFYYLYYLGQNRAREQSIGIARSRDGIKWEKLRSNPVLKPGLSGMDEQGLGEPAVWKSSGTYWMLFTGRDAKENRALGLAHSLDGVHWERAPDVIRGTEGWNSRVICDPTVVVQSDYAQIWFGAGDVASPDENLHGQIGYAVLHP
jgi:predicted GH43/DUF377 family glycosyl hydrolase